MELIACGAECRTWGELILPATCWSDLPAMMTPLDDPNSLMLPATCMPSWSDLPAMMTPLDDPNSRSFV